MGHEVVSEGGVGAGVAVGGAEAAGAQGGQPVHTGGQQLCRGGAGRRRQEKSGEEQGAGPAAASRGREQRRLIRSLQGRKAEG